MAPLKNTRRERFCLELAGGCTQSEAVRRAGYSEGSGRQFAARLRGFADVQARLKELQEAAASSSTLSIIQRKAWLSGIAVKEARKRPMAAIGAIAELNRMERAYEMPVEERPPIKIIEVHLTGEQESPPGINGSMQHHG